MFQGSQPLVHVLYHKANELVRQCMLTSIKPEFVPDKEGRDLYAFTCEDSKNWLDNGKMAVGRGTNRALKSVTESKQREIRLAIKTTAIYLQQHFRITNPILRDLQCLRQLQGKNHLVEQQLHDCVNN